MKTKISDFKIMIKNLVRGTRELTSKEVDELLNFGIEAGVHGRAGGRGCK
jgi:hypothetical protein